MPLYDSLYIIISGVQLLGSAITSVEAVGVIGQKSEVERFKLCCIQDVQCAVLLKDKIIVRNVFANY